MDSEEVKIWVRLDNTEHYGKVSIRNCDDLYDFIQATRKELFTLFANTGPNEMAIHPSSNEPPYPLDFLPSDLPRNAKGSALIIKVNPSPTVSAKHHIEGEETRKNKKPHVMEEGVILGDPLTLLRPSKCEEILTEVDKEGAVLIRAPPFSGKTGFAQVLEVTAKAHYQKVYYITLLGHDTGKKTFESIFYCVHHVDFASLLESTEKNLLIVDETQKLYSGHGLFWESIKRLMNKPTLNVVFLAAYGESPENDPGNSSYTGTPIGFKKSFSASFLALDKKEMDQYQQNFNETAWGRTSPLSEDIASAIFHRNGGHIGLTARTCSTIGDKFYNHSKRPTDDKVIMQFLLGFDMLAVINNSRALVGGQGVTPLSVKEEDYLKDVINSPTLSLRRPAGKTLSQCQLALIRKGILVVLDDAYIGFAAPVICSIYINRFYTSKSTKVVTTLPELLLSALPLMNQAVLRNSLSKGKEDSALYERQFQVEFYRAAMEVLGNTYAYCSPDVGRIFGSSGYLDFYVDSEYQWGVELVRNSNRLKEHLERFQPNGIYKLMPFKDFVVLDFVRDEEMDTEEGKHSEHKCVWKISYNENSDLFHLGRFGENGEKKVDTLKFLSTVHQG